MDHRKVFTGGRAGVLQDDCHFSRVLIGLHGTCDSGGNDGQYNAVWWAHNETQSRGSLARSPTHLPPREVPNERGFDAESLGFSEREKHKQKDMITHHFCEGIGLEEEG